MTHVVATRRAISRHRCLALLTSLLLVAVLAGVVVARDQRPAGSVPADACPEGTAVPAGYAASDCTLLLNKGTGAVVGHLFYRTAENPSSTVSTPRLDVAVRPYLNAPSGANTDLKLCVDDEADPYGDSPRVSCLGGTAARSLGTDYTVGSGRHSLRLPGDPEEADDTYEYIIERAGLRAVVVDAEAATGGVEYRALIGTPTNHYLYHSFHFNNGVTSIEGFFDLTPPPPQGHKLQCNEDTVLGGGDIPTYTVRIEGDECPPEGKDMFFDAGTRDAGPVGTREQFVELVAVAADEDPPTVLFLEQIDWLGVESGQEPPDLYYDDDGNGARIMRTCQADPRVVIGYDEDDKPIYDFDIVDTLTADEARSTILPEPDDDGRLHTSCVAEILMRIVDGEVFYTHVVFNVGDLVRLFR